MAFAAAAGGILEDILLVLDNSHTFEEPEMGGGGIPRQEENNAE